MPTVAHQPGRAVAGRQAAIPETLLPLDSSARARAVWEEFVQEKRNLPSKCIDLFDSTPRLASIFPGDITTIRRKASTLPSK